MAILYDSYMLSDSQDSKLNNIIEDCAECVTSLSEMLATISSINQDYVLRIKTQIARLQRIVEPFE